MGKTANDYAAYEAAVALVDLARAALADALALADAAYAAFLASRPQSRRA